MDDRAKIAALCEAVRVLWWDGVGGVLDPAIITGITHLLKTCEEQDEGVPVTDEESIDFLSGGICEEHGGFFDDNPGRATCKTCEDWS